MQNLKHWCDLELTSVHQKCILSSGGCLIWSGGKSTPKPNQYGRKRVKIPILDIASKVMYVHRIVYMCHNYDMRILDKNLGLEVSHLCHNSLCARPTHLVLETHEQNSERLSCKLMGHCTKNHSPECIFTD